MSGSIDNRSLPHTPHTPQTSPPPSPSSASSARPPAPSSSDYATSSLNPKPSNDDSPGCCASCFACFIQTIKNFIDWVCGCCFGSSGKPEAEDRPPQLPQGAQLRDRTPDSESESDEELPPKPAAAEPQAAALPPRPLKAPGVLPLSALKSVLEDTTQLLTEEQVQRVIDGLKKDVLTPKSFKELFELAAGRACGAKAYPDRIRDGSVPLMAVMNNYELFCGNDQHDGSLISYQLQVAMVQSESADQLETFINSMDPSKRIFRVFKEAYHFAKQLIDPVGKEMPLDVLLKNRSLFPVYQGHFPEYSKREMDNFLSEELTNFKTTFSSGPLTKAHATLLTIVGKHAPEANKLLLFVIDKGVEHRSGGSLLGGFAALLRGENPANHRETYDLCLDVVKGLLAAPTTVIDPEIAIACRPLCFHLAQLIEANSSVREPPEHERHSHVRMQQTANYCRDLLCAVTASRRVNILATVDGEHAISYLAVHCDKVSLDRIIALRPEVFDPLAFQEVSLLLDHGLGSRSENLANAYEMAYRHGRLYHTQRFQTEAIVNLRQFIASYLPAARLALQGSNTALLAHFSQIQPLNDLVMSYLTPVHMQPVPQSAPRSTAP